MAENLPTWYSGLAKSCGGPQMKAISTALIASALECAVHSPVALASTEAVLCSSCRQVNCTDGATPVSGLTSVEGVFYGTTYYGDASGEAAVFLIVP